MIGAEWKTGGNALASEVWDKYKDPNNGDDWLESARAIGFQCTDCKTPVYFVKGGLSSKGRIPHFKLSPKTPHTLASCPPKPPAPTPTTSQPNGTVQKPGVLGDGGVKVIKYRKPTPFGQKPVTTGGATGVGGSTGSRPATKYVPGNGTPNKEEPTFLDAHLSLLRNTTDYPGPGVRLKVTERGELNATDYFCQFESATDSLAAKTPNGKPPLMAYWGKVHTANKSGNLFLNSKDLRDGNGGMAVMLPKSVWQLLLSEIALTDHKELEDRWVIAEGRLELTRTGSRMVRVEDTTRIVIHES